MDLDEPVLWRPHSAALGCSSDQGVADNKGMWKLESDLPLGDTESYIFGAGRKVVM